MTALKLAIACAVDAALGDPADWPHPVRFIGGACVLGERLARAYARGDARRESFGGTLLCVVIVGGTYLAARTALRAAYRADSRFGFVFETVLGGTTLAARNLLDEASAVIASLERGDLAQARLSVARIVGRDTAQLNVSEISRATIETLAESACDGIVAPLLALAIGGVPLALAFKAVSTLDSMIGHIELPYTYLGRTAARLDDLACYVPARATALFIAWCAPLTGEDRKCALAVLRADGHRHRSPNAGRPEAALAGAIGVRLGGTNRYDGVANQTPYLGPKSPPPTVRSARRALRLVGASAFVAAAALILISTIVHAYTAFS